MKTRLKALANDILTATVGNLLMRIRPEKVRQLSEEGLTIVHNNSMGIGERLMRKAILKKLEKSQDYNNLEELHKTYWKNKGSDFFSETEGSFEKEFLPNCAFIFDELEAIILKSKDKYSTLVEIGTGNGRVLDYLSSRFTHINRFVGIDLSETQININNEKFKNDTRLEFVAADGFEWLEENGKSNMIFLTSRGVLEYFTQERLQAFFKEINNLGKTIFIAIEPKGIDHNFEINPESQPYGYERSFSHNYQKLFKDAGFSLWHTSYKPLDSFALMGFIGAEN